MIREVLIFGLFFGGEIPHLLDLEKQFYFTTRSEFNSCARGRFNLGLSPLPIVTEGVR